MSDSTDQTIDEIADVEDTGGETNPSGTAVAGRPSEATPPSLGRLADVTLDVSVELGRVSLPVRDLLALDEGGVVRLDHPVGEPVDLIVNGLRTARGEVVVVDGRLGLRITELVES